MNASAAISMELVEDYSLLFLALCVIDAINDYQALVFYNSCRMLPFPLWQLMFFNVFVICL